MDTGRPDKWAVKISLGRLITLCRWTTVWPKPLIPTYDGATGRLTSETGGVGTA